MAHSKVNLGECLYQRKQGFRIAYSRSGRKRYKYYNYMDQPLYRNSQGDTGLNQMVKTDNHSKSRSETQQLIQLLYKSLDHDIVDYFNYNKKFYGDSWYWD